MGDAFDEDEGRLMIAEVLDSSNLNISGTSANSKKTNSACAKDDGVFNSDSKEEGEIDDEEDPSGNSSAGNANAPSAVSQQNTGTWSAMQQSHGYETLLNGGNKNVYNVDQHSDRNRSATSHQISGVQTPTTSASATTAFSNHPCSSQVSVGETSDGGTSSKQADASHSGGHYKRSQDGTRQRSKVKKTKEEVVDISSRQGLRNDGFTNDIDCAVAGSSSTYLTGGRGGKKKKLSNEDGDSKENASDSAMNNTEVSAPSTPVEVANKRRKLNTRDKATCVSSRSIQTNDNDLDVKEGMSYCLDFTVIGKVSNHLMFVSQWNGRDLYGVLGDGRPPMEHAYMSRRQAVNSNGTENGSETTNNANHDRCVATPSKQRTNSKRSNRSSSVCPVNGFPEKSASKKGLSGSAGRPASASTSELPSAASDSLQDEETSQSPVSWLSAGGGDPLYGVGIGSIGSSSGLTQLREACTSGMLACSVAGCGYRFITQSEMTLHRRSHFDRSGQRAIYLESVGTQTSEADFGSLTDKGDKIPVKEKTVKTETVDISTDPPPDLIPSQPSSNKPMLSQISANSSDVKTSSTNVSTDSSSTTTLSSTEQQSIKKMFEVVARPVESGGLLSSPALKKNMRAGADTKAVSKGFEGSLIVNDQSCSSSNALDAIQKMVSDGAQSGNLTLSPGIGLYANRQESVNRQEQLSGVSGSPAKSAISGVKKAGSPFSDLSDDAPVLAPEVTDKSSEPPLVTIKLPSISGTGNLLSPLCLSMSGEKSNDVHVSSGEASSAGLLCTSVSSVTTSSTNTLSNSSVEITTISKKAETKQLTGLTPVVNAFSPISPFPGLDGNAFSQALRPPLGMPVGATGLQVASTSAGLLPQPPYIMMPFSMPAISSSPVAGSGKHKIHDLKTTSSGVSNTSKENSPLVRMSPSMIASPGTRPPSVGPSGGPSVNMKSNQQQLNVNASTSNQRSSSGTPFMMAQPISAAQSSNERNAANISFLQQQQQQQQQAIFFQQCMNQMRFPTAFPGMITTPTSLSMAQQAAAYEQLAAMQQYGVYPQFQPK